LKVFRIYRCHPVHSNKKQKLRKPFLIAFNQQSST
jgi:hypothetical protein